MAIKERVVSGPTIESLRPPFQLINKVRPSGFVAERAEPIKADKRDAELEWGMGMSGIEWALQEKSLKSNTNHQQGRRKEPINADKRDAALEWGIEMIGIECWALQEKSQKSKLKAT